MTLQDTPGSSDTNLVQYPYRRGATVVGADGQTVGTLEQIVVDRESGVLRSLIVRSASGEREFELPEDRVSRNEGDTVHLSVGADELATRPELARPYDPHDYLPVEQGETAGREEASRIARETGQPVVAAVGDNAAEVIAPETPAAPSGDGGVAAHEAGMLPPQPRSDAATDQKTAAGAPDVTAGSSAVGAVDEAATSMGEAPPQQTASATESTTGELIGGRPTTGGVGAASVAPVQSYPQDTPQTPEGIDLPTPSERAADPGLIQAFREAGDRPEFSSPGEPLHPALTGTGKPPYPVFTADSLDVQTPAVEQPATAPAFSRARSLLAEPPGWATPRLFLAAGSIGAGVVAGILMRRRQQRPSARAQRSARTAQRKLTDTLQAAGEQARGRAAQAGESAGQARRQAARTAKRTARRARWFRRGLVLGAASGILFAPQPGERLRERVRDNVSQRFARGA